MFKIKLHLTLVSNYCYLEGSSSWNNERGNYASGKI